MAAAVARPATFEHAAPAQAAIGACGAHGPPHTAAKEQSQLDAYNGREDQEHVQSGREQVARAHGLSQKRLYVPKQSVRAILGSCCAEWLRCFTSENR